MADVYLAVAPTGGPVAVKVLRADTEAPGPPRGPGATGAPATCQREYLLASTMDSDCTAPALGYGTSTAGAYLVTAYLPGYRCATTLLGRPIRIQQLWRFGSALARTLAAVHTRGVVHCDVKPANLLVHGHDVRIIDFGIARYVGERSVGGVVQCSRGWAAPEQLWSTLATPAVDIFAWGCLIAHLSTGIHPFASQSEQEWILRLHSAQPDLSGLPPGLDEVIRATLARDPQDRPSARELATICRARGERHPERIPARWASATASATPARDGSTMATSPSKVSSDSASCRVVGIGWPGLPDHVCRNGQLRPFVHALSGVGGRLRTLASRMARAAWMRAAWVSVCG
jgi:serine/threonine protein kinase